jgi:UDP-N-acetylmuramoyl-L-alanyl-D-glutamate--2,6-diaminopimelate ligase
MRLDRLASVLGAVGRRGDLGRTEVSSVTFDSRDTSCGALFCCIPGGQRDGHDFAAEAVAAGASALLVERPLALDVPQVVVEAGTAREAMALAAAEVYGHPSRDLVVVGVTGTNGKTTVTHMLQSILESSGTRTAVIGTIGGALTTPEAPLLQRELASHRGRGGGAVVMEVSSHALDQHRVDGIHFAVAVFTNLSPDHLDYHRTMQRYFESKAALFAPGRTDVGVVNADDDWGRELLGRGGIRLVPYSAAEAEGLSVGLEASTFSWAGARTTLRLGGWFNVSNAVAAMTAARELGIPPAAAAEGISSLASVPGRMEPVHAGQPFSVLVDFAHTPAGLEAVLGAARQAAGPDARLIVVFGCGGDRDRAKRPAMGEVASRLADLVVVTSDNPRSEDPMAIIAEVVSGVPPGRAVVDPDRPSAVATALGEAGPGDVVVVAGKGHEPSQQLGGLSIEMDDREVARSALRSLGWDARVR